MSNALAIAAVTSTVRFVLDLALQAPQPGQVGGAKVTTLRPDRLADAVVKDLLDRIHDGGTFEQLTPAAATGSVPGASTR